MSSSTTPASELQEQTAANLYDSDSYAWSVKQAAALRRRDFAAVDWDNVIEEIESVGGRHEDSWTSNRSNAIEHLLYIEHYKEATKEALESWVGEVHQFRRRMAKVMVKNPGLQGKYQTMFAEAWQDARQNACDRLAKFDRERNRFLDLDTSYRKRDYSLPKDCPYRSEDVTAFQLKRDKVPRRDVWPPEITHILNDRLFTNYPTQEQEWSR